ncbi:SH2 domain-containing protein [Limtongia smithiae]|uniref:SH2 domain-containing protein n=1 Tax=Limtongia smithiae TaxID=1125753 RepID=UPI0034CFF51F
MSSYVDRLAEEDRSGEDDSGPGSDDEQLDADTGKRTSNGGSNNGNGIRRNSRHGSDAGSMDDSSEEEDDDDDEEEMAKVREGFIVDDDEDEMSDGERDRRRRRRRKRRRREMQSGEEEETHHRNNDELDEDDLDLVMENAGIDMRKPEEAPASKRQKRANDGLTDMFADEDREQSPSEMPAKVAPRNVLDEFDDFIEEDELSDDEAADSAAADSSRAAKSGGRSGGRVAIPGVNQEQLGEIFEIFGDGEEYDWALEAEEAEAGDEYDEDKPLTELKDVFEPSELAERMLTDEDNAIRAKDEPERFQLLRKPFARYKLTEDESYLEETWIIRQIVAQKSDLLDRRPEFETPLSKAIHKVLDFIVKEQLEVPFIWHHRRDYILYDVKRENRNAPTPISDEYAPEFLLDQDDLWQILQLDIKFHSIIEKKHNVDKLYTALKVQDISVDQHISNAENLQDYQDLWDYLQFRYSAKIKDLASTQPANVGRNKDNSDDEDEDNEENGVTELIASGKRPNSRYAGFERIRSGPIYNVVRAFGLTAEQFGVNFQENEKLHNPTDSPDFPLDLVDHFIKPADGTEPNSDAAMSAFSSAKSMYAEEIFHDLRTRNFLRKKIIRALARMNVHPTEKGRRTIDETHEFYHFKFARNLDIHDILSDPETYLEILKAESQGLVTVQFKLYQYDQFFQRVCDNILSDNTSEAAQAWNKARKSVLRQAMGKLLLLMCGEIREDMRTQCQNKIAQKCRTALLARLDQAPYKPLGFELGTTPRVISLSNGMGDPIKDATVCIFMDDQGRLVDTLKLGDMRDDLFRVQLVDFVKRCKPDVMCMAGFSVSSNRLYRELLEIIHQEKLTTPEDESGQESALELVWVNDEVARLYQNSPRAIEEFSELAPLVRYCIALARYVQSPLLEYAAMGKDIFAIEFHRQQTSLPRDLLRDMIESAFIDITNMVGVEINEAIKVPYVANVLQYVSGLGPRKASGMLKAISSSSSGFLNTRFELATKQICGVKILMNCASFLKITWDDQDAAMAAYRSGETTEILDSTRIHPEDYELAKKMAADALELDEEDLVDLEGQGGVVAQLMEDDPEKLNELILEEYAEELLKNFNQRKRATLEIIKDELQHHYFEQRKPFKLLTEEEVFTMLTGETPRTLAQGMVVSANIRKVADRFLIAKLSCGIDGNVNVMDMTSRTDMPYPAAMFYYGQTVRAVIKNVNYGTFQADLSLIEEEVDEALKHPVLPFEHAVDWARITDKWDAAEAERDRVKFDEKHDEEEKRGIRVIKHRLFKPFNAKQAEEYLAPMQRGDLVIRPSSMGSDHIAITWKVAEGVYQHIAVLELEKENDYTLGKVLKIGDNKYSDLDELIFMHVQAMARKVDEMMNSDKFQRGSVRDVEKWLNTYTEANPRRSSYAFCLNTKNTGYFDLCFKAGQNAKLGVWPVKVIPNGYMLNKAVYPSVQELCNGFKTMYQARMMHGRR